MDFILFVVLIILMFIFLTIGITTKTRVWLIIGFIFMIVIGLTIWGTGLNLPSGWAIG